MKIISIALLFSSVSVDASDISSSTSSLRKKQSSPPPPKKNTPTRRQEERSMITLEQVSFTSCKSDPLFQDSLGDTCDWYDTYTSYGCGTVADAYKNSRGVSANRACCACGGGYEFYPTADSHGNDIDNVSESIVFQECDSDPTCDGFNSNGWVKHTVLPKSQWYSWTTDATKGFYVKKTALDGFDFVPFMDSSGNDIENSNRESVLNYAEECHADPECKGFNSNGWLKYEIKPFDEWSRWTEDASKGFYVKKA